MNMYYKLNQFLIYSKESKKDFQNFLSLKEQVFKNTKNDISKYNIPRKNVILKNGVSNLKTTLPK